MSKLIAIVAIAILVNGVRSTINPGDEVTGLSALDEQDLKRMGAVQDQDDVSAEDKAAAKAEALAKKDFADARKLEKARTAASGMTLQA